MKPPHIVVEPHPSNPPPGMLIRCVVCNVGSWHCGHWVTPMEVERRRVEMVDTHAACAKGAK